MRPSRSLSFKDLILIIKKGFLIINNIIYQHYLFQHCSSNPSYNAVIFIYGRVDEAIVSPITFRLPMCSWRESSFCNKYERYQIKFYNANKNSVGPQFKCDRYLNIYIDVTNVQNTFGLLAASSYKEFVCLQITEFANLKVMSRLTLFLRKKLHCLFRFGFYGKNDLTYLSSSSFP